MGRRNGFPHPTPAAHLLEWLGSLDDRPERCIVDFGRRRRTVRMVQVLWLQVALFFGDEVQALHGFRASDRRILSQFSNAASTVLLEPVFRLPHSALFLRGYGK